jgi:hypothetical protein
MEYFQSAVLSVSVILLILCLIAIGISLYTAKFSEAYPPVLANCPDYWLDNSSGDASECVNEKGLGNAACQQTMDFSGMGFSGQPGMCKKKAWAKSCDITWDGITNNDLLPCM